MLPLLFCIPLGLAGGDAGLLVQARAHWKDPWVNVKPSELLVRSEDNTKPGQPKPGDLGVTRGIGTPTGTIIGTELTPAGTGEPTPEVNLAGEVYVRILSSTGEPLTGFTAKGSRDTAMRRWTDYALELHAEGGWLRVPRKACADEGRNGRKCAPCNLEDCMAADPQAVFEHLGQEDTWESEGAEDRQWTLAELVQRFTDAG